MFANNSFHSVHCSIPFMVVMLTAHVMGHNSSCVNNYLVNMFYFVILCNWFSSIRVPRVLKARKCGMRLIRALLNLD